VIYGGRKGTSKTINWCGGGGEPDKGPWGHTSQKEYREENGPHPLKKPGKNQG